MEFLEKVEIKQEPFDEDEVSETAEESVSIKNKSVENGQVKFSETEISDKVNLIKDEEKPTDRNESPVKEPDPTVNSNSMLNHASCTKKENVELPSTSKVNDSMTMGDSDVKHNDTDELFKPEEILIKVEPHLSEDESVDGKDVTDDDDEFGEADPIKENEFVSDEDEEMSCDWNESEPAESERDPLALDSVLQIDIKTESPSDEESTYITSESASTSKADGAPYFCQKCRCGFVTLDQHMEHKKFCTLSDESGLHIDNHIRESTFEDSTPKKSRRKRKTMEKRHKCSQCDYSTRRQTDLKNHIMTHTGEKPHKCSHCDYSSVTAHALTKHIRIHTGEKPYKCSLCDYLSASSNNLKTHMISHTGQKPFKCTECDYSAVTSTHLKTHMVFHTGVKPFKCTECDYSAPLSSILTVHMRSHTGKRPFKCTECDYSAGRADILKNHMRTHSGEKPYKCSVCTYCASTSFGVKKHMNVHTGHKPHKCPKCDYSAAEKRHLKRHMVNHSEDNPYKCSQCNYSCVRLNTLKYHERFHST